MNLIWFRQDLRIHDNPALAAAAVNYEPMIGIYILDETINEFERLIGAQRWWLHHSLTELKLSLEKSGIPLLLKRGDPEKILMELISVLNIDHVFWNQCYEPFAIKRDTAIKECLNQRQCQVTSLNGSLLAEPWHVKNQQGNYFKVFTPFWRHCQTVMKFHTLRPAPKNQSAIELFNKVNAHSDDLDQWQLLPTKPDWAAGFREMWQPGEKGATKRLNHFLKHHLHHYGTMRDRPDVDATSTLSPHIHFGEISPMQVWLATEQAKVEYAIPLSQVEKFRSQLGWREFSYHLLYHFPELTHRNFRPEFDAFPWENIEKSDALKRWQRGLTGYPMVDAGMRQLWHIGYMHNRVRMITASFLTKNLFINWVEGERWFQDTLVDADVANNAAGWQWVAGSGADAAPYFRVFNPVLQGEKFDPEGIYIKRWIPELTHLPKQYIHRPWKAPAHLRLSDYPDPIVQHDEARDKALRIYQQLKHDR